MEQLKIFCEKNLFDPYLTVGLKDAFSKSWSEVYFNNGVEKSDASAKSWADLITSFLGMPFFSGIVSWESFCKNFFGWDEQKYLLPINIIKAFLFSLFNIVFIVPRLILNIVKLLTEFFPLFLRVGVNAWISELINLLRPGSPHHWVTKIFIASPLIILFPLYVVFKLAHIIGRAITSPHKNLYAAWQAGKELAGDGVLGKIAGGLFCLVGLALTTLAYLILFPIAIKLIMTYAPTVITSAVQTVLNFLAPLSSFGKVLGTVTTPIFHVLGGFFSGIGTPVINGLAGVVGSTVGPFIVLLDKMDEGLSEFTTWWRFPTKELKKQSVNISTKKPQNKNLHPKMAPEVVKNWQTTFDSKDLVLVETLGEGSFGVVYKAQCNGKPVAVKRTKGTNSFATKEVEREFEVMHGLRSSYIVRVYGVCVSERMIVMEYMAGGSLATFLRQEKAPPWKDRYQIGIDITEGMAYLQTQRVIHGDLKSENVLLDEDLRAKITDFGTSKLKSGGNQVTQIGPDDNVCRGTLRWMAPELHGDMRQKTSMATDVYSYGMILWELGARKIPYADLSDDTFQLVAHEKKRRETITPDTPEFMASVIKQCWKHDPDGRPKLDGKLVVSLTQEFYKKYSS